MKASIAMPLFGLVASVLAQDNITTIVTTVYTTYCPAPTTFAYHNKTYTVTEPTTLTILDCPCTLHVSKPPVYTTVVPCTTGIPYGNNTNVGVPPPASTTITVTPPVTTYLPVTPCPSSTPVGGGSGGGAPGGGASATNTPVQPKPSNTAVVTANAAAHVGSGMGAAAILAGMAAYLL